jgi:3'-phosphoadenosine 5'-phosphosulfate sulfotransferase (PAPS reductase)/FAD synthetase
MKIIVPVSGGKDSQACLKLAIERLGVANVEGVFCDTGFEHPNTYQHIDYMADYYNVNIHKISNGNMNETLLKRKRFPHSLSRFCTSDLKITPMRDFLSTKKDSVVYYGMRAAESKQRDKKYGDLDSNELIKPNSLNVKYPNYLHNENNIMFQLPIVHWSVENVFDYLSGDKINPLYKGGFNRVGCFPCLISGKKDNANSFNYDGFGKKQKRKIIEIEDQLGEKYEPFNTNQTCLFCTI